MGVGGRGIGGCSGWGRGRGGGSEEGGEKTKG